MTINIGLMAHCSHCNEILKGFRVPIVALPVNGLRSTLGPPNELWYSTYRKFHANCLCGAFWSGGRKQGAPIIPAILRPIKNLNMRICSNPRLRRYFSERCFFIEILGELIETLHAKQSLIGGSLLDRSNFFVNLQKAFIFSFRSKCLRKLSTLSFYHFAFMANCLLEVYCCRTTVEFIITTITSNVITSP